MLFLVTETMLLPSAAFVAGEKRLLPAVFASTAPLPLPKCRAQLLWPVAHIHSHRTGRLCGKCTQLNVTSGLAWQQLSLHLVMQLLFYSCSSALLPQVETLTKSHPGDGC